MENHWPLVVACGLIALAGILGLVQHDKAVEAANFRDPTAQRPVKRAPRATDKPDEAPPPLTTAEPRRERAPETGAETPRKGPPPNPNAIPGAPGAPTRGIGSTAILKKLRDDLQTKVNVAAVDLPNGGFSIVLPGAKLETAPSPNWCITIYNDNPKAAEVETANFKVLLDATTNLLAIDTANTTPQVTPSGKSVLKTSSRIGPIVMLRDPAIGNLCTIRPNRPPPTAPKPDNAAGPNKPGALEGAAPVNPPKVKIPKTPVAPPAPPAEDKREF